jgi:CNT family concentrative nucleoside transporter
MLMNQTVAIFGYVMMVVLAWLISLNRRQFPWRVVLWGTALQVSFAALILKTASGRRFFESAGAVFGRLIEFGGEGSRFLFGEGLGNVFAFSVLPIIIFFSALTSVLYHAGVMQVVVKGIAWVMQRTLGTSGAESLSAAANIFVGQTEAPLVVKPYVARMTSSELMAIMVGGFATIAGSVMAIYVSFGMDAGHLLTASVISAPAGLLIAKVLQPETETSETAGSTGQSLPRTSGNLIEAISSGASDGLMLMLNVGAMLVAFTSLIALADYCLTELSVWVMGKLSVDAEPLTMSRILGTVFAPLAWLMGIPWQECRVSGQLLGVKMVATEFVAYQQLGEIMKQSTPAVSPRSAVILTYALCGFSNFASIGIQVGGIGALAPERRADLTRLAFRAMLGGTLACCMTGCIAAVLI